MIITGYIIFIICVYFVCTIVYFKFLSYKHYSNKTIWRSIFFVFFVIFLAIMLFGLAQFACKKINSVYEIGLAIIFPILLIFLLMMVCLWGIPGWVRIFSNTIGSLLANDKTIIDSAIRINNTIPNITLEEVRKLYTKPYLFIDELDISDYNEDIINNIVSWPTFTNIMTNIYSNANPSSHYDPQAKRADIKALYEMLLTREYIGNCCWYLMIGSITIFVSANTLFTSGCSP